MKYLLASFTAVLLALSGGCGSKGTFVLVRVEGVLATDVASVDLALALTNKTDTATIRNSDGTRLALPFTRALQIIDGVGRMQVTATAKDAAGNTLATATDAVDLVKGDITGLTLVLGSATTDLAGADLAVVPDLAPAADLFGVDFTGVDLLAPDDLTTLDLTGALPPPAIVVTPPTGPYYELNTDGVTPYVWTVTATQAGAALPPVLYFDSASLAPNMIPATTGPGSATLSFLPSYRQSGSFTVKVIAASTAQPGNDASTTFVIPVINTVDPISSPYGTEDSTLFAAPKSVGVAAIGDFNGDGFDDLVHATKSRTNANGSSVDTVVRFYVFLGSANGLLLTPDDSTFQLSDTDPQLRRFSVTTSQLPTGNDNLTNETQPQFYDGYEMLSSSALFVDGTDDKGKEIFYLDPTYRYVNGQSWLGQIFAAPSNAPTGSSLVPLLDPAKLMTGYSCLYSCEYSMLAGGDVNGDGRDDLYVYSKPITGSAETRTLQYIANTTGAPMTPTFTPLAAGGAFGRCTSSTASSNTQIFGIGNVLPGAGLDFGLFGCTNEYGGLLANFFSDGAAGYPDAGRQAFYTPPRSESNTTNAYTTVLCDVDGDGRDDLARINYQPTPPVVEVYLNRGPMLSDPDAGAAGGYTGPAFPVTSDGVLDTTAMLSLKLPLSPTGYGSWQVPRCVRSNKQAMLFTSRSYSYEQMRYESLQIKTDATGQLTTVQPWSNGVLKWPGDQLQRLWFNRPRYAGDFNGDGKLDVVTAASTLASSQTFWNVVYGR